MRVRDDQVQQNLAKNTHDYAWWDDAARAAWPTVQPSWWDENIAAYLQNNWGYDYIFVVRLDGTTDYASRMVRDRP